MATEHYNWEYLREGDDDYPTAHNDLVDRIDAEINRVESTVPDLLDESGNVTANIDNQRTQTDDAYGLRAHTLTASPAYQQTVTPGRITFESEFIDEPFGDGDTDALVFHHSRFDDGRYRVLVQNTSTDAHRLYATTDFASYTQLSADILPNLPVSGQHTMQDHVVLPDGRFALYETVGEGGANPRTEVWVGESLMDLTNQGAAVDGWVDCGVFLDPQGTVHVFPEGEVYENEPCSDYIKHFTTPWNDLTNATQHADAVDVSDRVWHTGDVEVVQLGGTYYMFLDRSPTHPTYHIAVFESDDLYNWQLTQDKMTSTKGGDIALTAVGGVFHGFTEFSGANESGIGHVIVEPQVAARSVANTKQQLARSEPVHHVYTAGPLDGYYTTTSGSGGISLQTLPESLVMESGATADSHATVLKSVSAGMPVNGAVDSWDQPRVFSADIGFADTSGPLYAVSGSVGKTSKTGAHIGFAMQNSDLIGTVADGSTQSTTTLISGVSTGNYRLRCELTPRQEALFFVNGTREGAFDHTANLPTGANDSAARAFQLLAQNSTATNRSMFVRRVESVRG